MNTSGAGSTAQARVIDLKSGKRVTRIECSTAQAILDLIKNNKGKFFYIKFEKINGDIREAVARLGVSKGVKGTAKHNHADYGNLAFYEVVSARDYKGRFTRGKEQFRACKAEKIQEIHFRGKELICSRLP